MMARKGLSALCEESAEMEIYKTMTAPVRTMCSADTIAHAAKLMAEFDIGAVPVVDGEDLVGIVTDRDIAVRGVAAGLDMNQPIARVMTSAVATCPEAACIDDVLARMITHGVRRLPICSAEGKMVGIASLSDLARIDWDKREIGTALGDICASRRLASPAPALA
jgi:CBS domain-containing protein